MAKLCKNDGFYGFSLTEVLMAVGILSVGMVFIAGVFPVGIYFATVATERTIAAVTADEAFAKIRIYDVNLTSPLWPSPYPTRQCVDFNEVSSVPVDPCEFTYPSFGADISQKQYFWSALCRRAGDDPDQLVQVTVFVCRKVSPNLEYLRPPDGSGSPVNWPKPVRVPVSSGSSNNELQITGERTLINDGYTIVDDATGRIYRVLERYKDPYDDTILLNRDWEGGTPNAVWVVPPPVTRGRYPCIAVYQRVIKF